ncbi:MAG: hypothetical protein KF901_02185 [Myxococcales bacterium]|nr:hypothetical protein [Myxococcales bacterium]
MATKQAKRQKKSGATKKRQKGYAGPRELREGGADEEGGSAMQGLVSGFRRAVGVETKKQKTWVDYIWTLLLILAVAAVALWRFGGD